MTDETDISNMLERPPSPTRAQRSTAVEELGRLWDTGISSGPAIDGETAFTRIRQKLDAKIAERGTGPTRPALSRRLWAPDNAF